jgi:hypothetical protein
VSARFRPVVGRKLAFRLLGLAVGLALVTSAAAHTTHGTWDPAWLTAADGTFCVTPTEAGGPTAGRWLSLGVFFGLTGVGLWRWRAQS